MRPAVTLVQLRHLISLAETGSFSRSAEALFLTQPALSRSIRSLEDELGQRLFDRIGWRTEPTPFGREVLARAHRLVAEATHLKESARRLAAGAGSTLKVGFGSGPGAILCAPLMRHFATHQPAARIEFARGSTERLETALRERRLDALVVDARSVRPSPDLEVETLAELQGTFMVRPGHPLTQRPAPLRFADLRGHPLASTPLSDEIARVLVERYGPEALPDEAVTLRSDDVGALVEVATATDAVLLAARAAAPGLVELDLQPPLQATARYGLVTLAGRSPAPLLPHLRDLAREHLRPGDPGRSSGP